LQSPTETWTLSPLASPDDEHVHQIWNEIDALIKSGGISDTIICEGRQLLYCKYGAWKRTNSIIQTSFMQNLASKVGLKYRECADRALTIRGHRFRVNTLLTKGKYKAVLRLLPSKILSPEEIGIPEHVVDLSVTARVGIILVVGVTGSGKSSTVAALLNNRGKNNAEHIITLEDPIEYLYPEDSPAEFTQREIGTDVPSFEKGLRAALREAPQIIFVGEIRDKETAEIALHAAETGHLVISTMHTGSASQTVQRYLDFFPGESGDVARAILAKMLVMVICQKLLPRCDTGGRIATFEIMINNSATKNLILKERWQDLDNSIDVGTQHGNISFARHIAMLVQEGVVDPAFLKDVKTT
jgi:twitching motility protein PilT